MADTDVAVRQTATRKGTPHAIGKAEHQKFPVD